MAGEFLVEMLPKYAEMKYFDWGTHTWEVGIFGLILQNNGHIINIIAIFINIYIIGVKNEQNPKFYRKILFIKKINFLVMIHTEIRVPQSIFLIFAFYGSIFIKSS